MARKSRRNPPPKKRKTTQQAKIDSFLNNLIKGGTQSSSPVQGDSVMDRILRPKQTAQLETARQMTEDEFEDLDELPEDVLAEMQDDVDEEYSEDEEDDISSRSDWDDDDYEFYQGEWIPPVAGGRRTKKQHPTWDPEGDWEQNPTRSKLWLLLPAIPLAYLGFTLYVSKSALSKKA